MPIRAAGLVAVVLIVVLTVLDFTGEFWVEHPFLAAIVGGVLLLAVGVAIVDRYVAARDQRRWRLVAAIALAEFKGNAEGLWRALLGAIGEPADPETGAEHVVARIEDPARAEELSAAIHATAADRERRLLVLNAIRPTLDHGGASLSRWASVMLQGEEHAVHLSEFTALIARVHRLEQELEADEQGRPLPLGEDWVAGRVAKLLDLSARMDLGFMAASRAIAPVEEWMGAPSWLRPRASAPAG